MFHTLLIANRGEIACRIIRTARALGYRTVAVFSDADREAPHVALADMAVHIGPSPAAQSYLRIDALLAAACQTGADAVHPGYGFLSENADFAQACIDAGLVFVGPPPAAITAMGDKSLAKRRMLAAGVPCAPGYLGAEQDDAALTREAQTLGFPLLVKAVAGGGGRGMRLVRAASELQDALEGARREAQGAFGDGVLMLERLIEEARHIEVQIFADAHGNAIHLGERDCTTQRRRQKIIEESPSPVVTDALRQAMGRDAVTAALAVGYQGAGTVEFIVDAQMRHYFLEMNTRLQVEHPVTEMVTGIDLVEWQLRIASGDVLPIRQDDVQLRGHSIEARLYAEDPYAGFAPQTGRVAWWRPHHALQPGVRIDDGILEGTPISPHYDPMVAKVIVLGRDRTDAIRRLRAALAATPLLGVKNNGGFLRTLLAHPSFVQAQMTTATLDAWQAQGDALMQSMPMVEEAWGVAAMAYALRNGSSWRANSVSAYDLTLLCGAAQRTVRVHADRHGRVEVRDHGGAQQVGELHHWHDGVMRLTFNGIQRSAIAVWDADTLHLAMQGHSLVFNERSALMGEVMREDPGIVLSPVAGTIKVVRVAIGDAVSAGQQLVCVEAMKMEMWLCAAAHGQVTAVHAQVGDQVSAGATLVDITLNAT